MRDIREARPGDLIRAREEITSSYPKGSVFLLISGGNTVTLECIVTLTLQTTVRLDVDYLIKFCEILPPDDISDIRRNYSLTSDSVTGKSMFIDRRGPVALKPTTPLSYEELAKIFKYIPVIYKNQEGFYYKGNIIVKKKLTKEKKVSNVEYDSLGRPRFKLYTKPTVLSSKEVIEFIPLDSSEVNKYYSDKPLKTFCKIKIKGYEKSSKLFAYSGEKKELLNKTLEAYDMHQKDNSVKKLTLDIIEVKLQDTVKKSPELQNTIAINGQTRKLRFVMEELEIIYPNINSWKPVADRVIKEGCTIKTRNKRKSRIITNSDLVVVSAIKKVGNKQYVSFTHNNRQYFDNIRNYKVVHK